MITQSQACEQSPSCWHLNRDTVDTPVELTNCVRWDITLPTYTCHINFIHTCHCQTWEMDIEYANDLETRELCSLFCKPGVSIFSNATLSCFRQQNLHNGYCGRKPV